MVKAGIMVQPLPKSLIETLGAWPILKQAPCPCRVETRFWSCRFNLAIKSGEVDNFGMPAFHVNSKTFGLGNRVDAPENGLDFSHVRIEVPP